MPAGQRHAARRFLPFFLLLPFFFLQATPGHAAEPPYRVVVHPVDPKDHAILTAALEQALRHLAAEGLPAPRDERVTLEGSRTAGGVSLTVTVESPVRMVTGLAVHEGWDGALYRHVAREIARGRWLAGFAPPVPATGAVPPPRVIAALRMDSLEGVLALSAAGGGAAGGREAAMRAAGPHDAPVLNPLALAPLPDSGVALAAADMTVLLGPHLELRGTLGLDLVRERYLGTAALVAAAPDGTVLTAAATRRDLYLYTGATDDPHRIRLPAAIGTITAIALLEDHSAMVVSGDGTTVLRVHRGRQTPVISDGNRTFTAAARGPGTTVWLWDSRQEEIVVATPEGVVVERIVPHVPRGSLGVVRDMAVSETGEALLLAPASLLQVGRTGVVHWAVSVLDDEEQTPVSRIGSVARHTPGGIIWATDRFTQRVILLAEPAVVDRRATRGEMTAIITRSLLMNRREPEELADTFTAISSIPMALQLWREVQRRTPFSGGATERIASLERMASLPVAEGVVLVRGSAPSPVDDPVVQRWAAGLAIASAAPLEGAAEVLAALDATLPPRPVDPLRDHRDASEAPRSPGTVLYHRRGTPEELAALLAAALHHGGIPVALGYPPAAPPVVLVDTGEPRENAPLFSGPRLPLVEHQGTLWVPLHSATTAGVHASWERAARELPAGWAVGGTGTGGEGGTDSTSLQEREIRTWPPPHPGSNRSHNGEAGVRLTPPSRSLDAPENLRRLLLATAMAPLEEELRQRAGSLRWPVQNRMAVVTMMWGDRRRGEALLREILALRGDYLPALVNLSALALREGRTADALELLDQAARIAPEDPVVRTLLNRDFAGTPPGEREPGTTAGMHLPWMWDNPLRN